MRSLVLSLFVFVAALFFSASTASAQVLGLIQNDYERYKQLFITGKDPNLSHHPTEGSPRWRALYRNHQWKAYAEETEFREPSLAAQILMGIYLTSFVDHELTYQINSIVLHKAHFSNAMAEYITLNRLGTYLQNKKPIAEEGVTSAAKMGSQLLESMGGGMEGSSGGSAGGAGGTGAEGSTAMQFYSPDELARMQRLGNNIHEAARKRMVSGRQITRRQNAEIRSVQNLFQRESKSWAVVYASMREKFIILDNLADSFTFNWDDVKREEEFNKLVESDKVRKIADQRVDNRVTNDRIMDGSSASMGMGSEMGMGMGMDSSMGGSMDMGFGGMPMGSVGMGAARYTEEEIESMKEKEPAIVAEEMLKDLEAQEAAFKYIVGVYEGSEFHLATLRTIRRYLQAGADSGDPIAQYHLALFLRYLGEFIDEDDIENKSQELLSKVAASDIVPKSRSEELNTYFVWESENEEKRAANMEIKLAALKKQEKEKIEMIEEILIIVEDQIGTIKSNSGTGGEGGSGGGAGGSGGAASGSSGG